MTKPPNGGVKRLVILWAILKTLKSALNNSFFNTLTLKTLSFKLYGFVLKISITKAF
ncbi:hypothetical protein HpDR60_25490 [Helicobacter pylori]